MPPHIDDKLHAVIPLVHRYGWQGANYAASQSSTLIFGTGGCRIIRLNPLCSLIYDDQFGIDGCHVAGSVKPRSFVYDDEFGIDECRLARPNTPCSPSYDNVLRNLPTADWPAHITAFCMVWAHWRVKY